MLKMVLMEINTPI